MKKATENPADIARECIRSGLLSATVSVPRKKSAENEGIPMPVPFSKIRVRPIRLKNDDLYQLEQFLGQKTFHRNISSDELQTLIETWLAREFSRAEFSTTQGTIQVLANRRGELTALRKNKINVPVNDESKKAQAHNREKKYILQEGHPVPFLIDLGIMTADGTIIKSKYDKFRQINRFLEFIADVVPDLLAAVGVTEDGKPVRTIRIVDFGCGKSYLTFAVYHYLSSLKNLPVHIAGLDLKDDVIEQCSSLARIYGYQNLAFSVGNIADYNANDTVDMMISLHACDTATDYALAQAIRWKTPVILAVPCCQHELHGQLSRDTALAPAFKHGIIRERMAALFTDVLRAELLEAEGYRTQILEFIDMSHTPKNLLIRAVRANKKPGQETDEKASAMQNYQSLRDFLGVRPTLEKIIR